MLTKEQEEYLAKFADVGIAEETDQAARNVVIEKEAAILPLIEAKKVELRATKDAEYLKELEEYRQSLQA